MLNKEWIEKLEEKYGTEEVSLIGKMMTAEEFQNFMKINDSEISIEDVVPVYCPNTPE